MIVVSYDKHNLAPVLLNLLNTLEKIRGEEHRQSLASYLFPPTNLINSIIQEHSGKMLNVHVF